MIMTAGVKNALFWGVTIVLFSAPFIFHVFDNAQPVESVVTLTPPLLNQQKVGILVHVSGAVAQPGVYTIEPGTKVIELIQRLELLPIAKTDHLNLAKTLRDGQKLIIKEHSQQLNQKVNINFATQKQLMSLPGIGRLSAQKIIEYRQHVGVIQSKVELEPLLGKLKVKKINGKVQF